MIQSKEYQPKYLLKNPRREKKSKKNQSKKRLKNMNTMMNM